MKIAVVGAKGLPAKQGGIEHYCQELYPRMVELGHSVDLFARSSYIDSAWMEQYYYKGVRVISLPGLQLRGMDAVTSSLLGASASGINQYDVIHFHALGPALFSWLPKIASTSKVVVTCQGLDWQRAKWGKFSSRMLLMGEQAAARFADEIIVVSHELRSYFMQTYNRETVYISNAPASYSEANPNFSYGTSLGLRQGRYIVFVGRLVPEKRPDLLIRAFQALQPPEWKLVLVGGTSDTNAFASNLTSLANGNPNVVFTGQLHGQQLAEIVQGAGLFVLPSDLEGLPLAMLEAMSQEVPVLASNIPAHQQLILGETEASQQWELGRRGILFQAGEVEACVQALNWAINHPQELATMAKNAKKYIEVHHNWDNITAENLNIYKTLSASSKNSSWTIQLPNRPAKVSNKLSR